MTRMRRALAMGMREQQRRPLVAVLIVALPFFFITRAIGSTEAAPRVVGLPGGGTALTTMRDIHGANMAAITVAFLGGVLGVFMLRRDAVAVDRRLIVAGFRPGDVLVPRLAVLAAGVAVAVGASLAVTSLSFTPAGWPVFAIGTALVALIYALIGVLLGIALGPLGATYALLFLAMIDLGIVQNPMFGSGTPPGWAVTLPGYGAVRMVIAGAFAEGRVVAVDLALSVAWTMLLAGAVAALAWRRLSSRRP